jgi:hypothetical protein
MPADIINLRRARKEKARAMREQEAAENRNRFGRTKADKERAALEAERAARQIEGHHRDDDDG